MKTINEINKDNKMNLTTLANMSKFTGLARKLAIKYVKKQFKVYKSHTGVYSNAKVTFVHPLSKTLKVSERVIVNLCKEASIPMSGTTPQYDTFKDPVIRNWAAGLFKQGFCTATVLERLTASGLKRLPTYGGLDSFRRKNVLNIDTPHATSGTSKFVNHQPRFRGKTETAGLGKRSNKPVQTVTQRYNLHISTLSRMLSISETQVTTIFTPEQIEHKTPSYLVALKRERLSQRKTTRR
jgi:hypothetical protein